MTEWMGKARTFLGLVCLAGCPAGLEPATREPLEDALEAELDQVSFRLREPVRPSELLRTLAALPEVGLSRVEVVYTMGDRTWYTQVHHLESTEPEALPTVIADAIHDTWQDLLGRDYTPALDEQAQYEAARAFVLGQSPALSPRVFSLDLSGPRGTLRQLAEEMGDGQAALRSDIEQIEPPPPPPLLRTAPADESWVPETGSVRTGVSTVAGMRYLTSTVNWNDKSGFAASGHYSTIEFEQFLDNSNGTTYLSTATTSYPNCYPSTYSTSHNFPASAYAYLDTRWEVGLSCPAAGNAVEYTWGLVYASQITTGTTYTVTMTVSAGAGATDQVRAQAEIGYCLFSCPSLLAFGVWAESVTNKCVVPTKSTTDCTTWSSVVPGIVNFTW